MKPLAILHSAFAQVLLLDSDNTPVKSPDVIFAELEKLKTSAIFWPDYWKSSLDNPIWSILGLEPENTFEQESGQVLVDKEKSWKALNFCMHLNTPFFMKLLNGDKDTFRFAWKYAKTPYHMIQHRVVPMGNYQHPNNNFAFCGHSMMQFDPNGDAMFVHHNHVKTIQDANGIRFDAYLSIKPSDEYKTILANTLKIPNRRPLHCYECVDVHTNGKIDGIVMRAGDDLSEFEAEFMAVAQSVETILHPKKTH